MSKTRIEFGKIGKAPFGFGWSRKISIIETDNVSGDRIVINCQRIHGDTKEDLEVIDHENFQEAEDHGDN